MDRTADADILLFSTVILAHNYFLLQLFFIQNTKNIEKEGKFDMAKNGLIGEYPAIGIRPTIDGRRGVIGIREALEDQTMTMARSVAKLFEETLTYSNGEPVRVVLADTTIGRVAEAAACAEKFRREGVDITLTVTPCWCYGAETMDMDPLTIKGVWGFNGTEHPGAVYLASVLATHAQKGLPAFAKKSLPVDPPDYLPGSVRQRRRRHRKKKEERPARRSSFFCGGQSPFPRGQKARFFSVFGNDGNQRAFALCAKSLCQPGNRLIDTPAAPVLQQGIVPLLSGKCTDNDGKISVIGRFGQAILCPAVRHFAAFFSAQDLRQLLRRQILSVQCGPRGIAAIVLCAVYRRGKILCRPHRGGQGSAGLRHLSAKGPRIQN